MKTKKGSGKARATFRIRRARPSGVPAPKPAAKARQVQAAAPGSKGANPLFDVLRKEKSAAKRLAAVEKVGGVRSAEARAALFDALGDKDLAVGQAARDALRERRYDDPGFADEVLRALAVAVEELERNPAHRSAAERVRHLIDLGDVHQLPEFKRVLFTIGWEKSFPMSDVARAPDDRLRRPRGARARARRAGIGRRRGAGARV